MIKPASIYLSGRLVLVAAAVLLTGCKRESITQYEVPKDQPATPAASQTAQSGMPELPKGHIEWTRLPDGWKDQPVTSAMRIANFSIQGTNGQDAELIVVPLPELADKEDDFVNMWRDQIQLPKASPEAIEKMKENIKIAGIDGQLYDMVGDAPPADSRFKQRMIVAMATQSGISWFFKLKGADELVANQKSALLTFLQGVTLHNSPAAGDPHAGLGLNVPMSSLPLPTAAGPGSTTPKWTVPAGWSSADPGSMLLAKFDVSGGGAEVSVLSLGGDGGGLLMNINRWRRQLQLAPVEESELNKITSTETLSGSQATLVDLSGGGKRMVAVIVPEGGQTWFYKCMGEPAAVGSQKDAFLQFVRSAQY